MLRHKFLLFMVILAAVISCLAVTAFASEIPAVYDHNIAVNESETDDQTGSFSTASTEPEGMLTRHKDGTVTVSYLTDAQIADLRSTADTSAYIPPSVSESAVTADEAVASDDPYGRTQMNPAEIRIGQLECSFNNDSDLEPDVTFYDGNSGGSMYGIATSYSNNASVAWAQSEGARIYGSLCNYKAEARQASKARWE